MNTLIEHSSSPGPRRPGIYALASKVERMRQPLDQKWVGLRWTTMDGERIGILWLSSRRYKSPAQFFREVSSMGVRVRLPSYPNGARRVLVASRFMDYEKRDGFPVLDMRKKPIPVPGIICCLDIDKVQLVVSGSESARRTGHAEKMSAEVVMVKRAGDQYEMFADEAG